MAADKSVFQVNSLRLAVRFCGLVKAVRESQAIGRCAETDSIEGWRDRLGASVPEANAVDISALFTPVNGSYHTRDGREIVSTALTNTGRERLGDAGIDRGR